MDFGGTSIGSKLRSERSRHRASGNIHYLAIISVRNLVNSSSHPPIKLRRLCRTSHNFLRAITVDNKYCRARFATRLRVVHVRIQ